MEDTSFGTGLSTFSLYKSTADGTRIIESLRQKYPDASITLTGHSLGGAIAQLLGEAEGLAAYGFNAPGPAQVYSQLVLEGALNPTDQGATNVTNVNYRISTDQFSLFGTQIGTVMTIPSNIGTSAIDVINNLFYSHSLNTVEQQLNSNTPTSGLLGPNYVKYIQDMVNQIITKPVGLGTLLTINVADILATYLPDPSGGFSFVLNEQPGSPSLNAIDLPILDGVEHYELRSETAGSWSTYSQVWPGDWTSLANGAQAVEFRPIGSSGEPLRLSDSFFFQVAFNNTGVATATLAALPTEQSDFSGDGNSDILLRHENGDLLQWDMSGRTGIGSGEIANPGPSWQINGFGDFNGDGRADILLRQDNGDLVLWAMNGTSIIGAESGEIAHPSLDWQVAGIGDLNGDGNSDILLRRDDGDLLLWEMNGKTGIGGGEIANPGPNWQVAGIGDFNADGNSDILLRRDDGDLLLWEMNGTTGIGGGEIANTGPNWHVCGVGDFNGDGNSDILLQHDNGDVLLWEMNGITGIGVRGAESRAVRSERAVG